MNIFEIIGVIAGICAAIPSIPQIIEVIKTKSAKGLSPSMYYIWILGGFCWIAYGRYLHSRQMQFFNTITVILSITMLFLIRKYKN